MILIFGSQAILDEIGYSPIIEGGIGAVKMGTPLVAKDGRVAICHPFSEVDMGWFTAYTDGENPKLLIVETLPADFVVESPLP